MKFCHIAQSAPAFVNSLFENFVMGRMDPEVFGAYLIAEFIGGYMAFRFARQIWWVGLSKDHVGQYADFLCTLTYKVRNPKLPI